MHRYFSKFQKIIALAGPQFFSSTALVTRNLRAKNIKNNFLSKYLLGLSILSTSACDGESGDPTSTSKMTEREMNLANLKTYDAAQKTEQTSFQDENLQNNTVVTFVTDVGLEENNITLFQESENADDNESIYYQSAGNVIKGPLNHALVFLDIDRDGRPVDEPFVYTKQMEVMI